MKRKLFLFLTVFVVALTFSLASCDKTPALSGEDADESVPADSVGLAFELKDDGTYEVVGIGDCTDKDIAIPATYEGKSVTSIGTDAFEDSEITSVFFPKSVNEIGHAFEGCKSLERVRFAKDSHLSIIFSRAFSGCEKLQAITLPKGLSIIGRGAFEECGLTSIEIPASVSQIGRFTFADCKNLTTVTIPSDSTAYIEEDPFVGCDSLRFNTFGNAKYLGNDENPYVALIKTTSDSITELEVHPNTKIIRSGIFDECEGLRFTTYDNASYLGTANNAHFALIKANAGSITSCEIHPDTKLIGSGAFHYCRELESIVIPEGVTHIGGAAFFSSSVKSVSVPSSVCCIGGEAFAYCRELESVTIPAGVKYIGGETFITCKKLSAITIPSSVEFIGPYAFCNDEGISSLVLSEGLTRIDMYAFACCDALTSVTVPASVTFIEGNAFPEGIIG